MNRALLAGACLLVPMVARADTNADTLRAQGVKAAGQKDWATARKDFEQSFALDPAADTQFDLAVAQAKTDQLVEAQASYQAYLERPSGTDPHLRKVAKDALAKLEREIPTLQIKVSGFKSDTIVELDGNVLGAAALIKPFITDPGDHTVVVKHAETVLATQQVHVERGERAETELTAAVLPQPIAVKPIEPTVLDTTKPPGLVNLPPPPVHQAHADFLSSRWFWGATVAVLGAAGLTYYYGIYNPAAGGATRGTLVVGAIKLP